MAVDFTPTMREYTNQGKFRYWVQMVLPTIYDDSLSYMELLNKVVYVINLAIEDVDAVEDNVVALLEAFEQLQQYTNDYFDNLDVQEEINNKLDEMVVSGELNRILNPVVVQSVSDWLAQHVTPTSPIVDNTFTISGAAADSKTVGDKILFYRKTLVGSESNNLLSNVDSIGGYAIASSNTFTDLPTGEENKAMHLDVVRLNTSYLWQRLTNINTMKTYYRFVQDNKVNISQWIGTPTDEEIENFKGTPSAATYNNLLSNITIDGLYFIRKIEEFTDKVKSGRAYILEVNKINNSYFKQKLTDADSLNVYERLVSYDQATIRMWKLQSNVMPLNILAAGDSYCYGYRNNLKGYVGYLSYFYNNVSHGGDSLALISGRQPIYGQIENLPSTKTVNVALLEGGFNDYNNSAPLGTLPTKPVQTDDEMNALDLSTVSGGLQKLLYLTIKKWPHAKRFFIFTHRVLNYPWTPNTAGYTQTDLHDFVKKVCEIYSTQFIDIFNDGFINTAYDSYISPTPYNTDHSVTDQYYVDSDGIHPLNKGYKECYVPLINQAIQNAYDL